MIGSLLFFALAGTQQGCKAHAAQGRQPLWVWPGMVRDTPGSLKS